MMADESTMHKFPAEAVTKLAHLQAKLRTMAQAART